MDNRRIDDGDGENDQAARMLEARVAEVIALRDQPADGVGAAATEKHFMSVDRVALFAANWVPSAGLPPSSGPTIYLYPKPSPTPQIALGFIHFVDPTVKGALRRPVFDKDGRKWLRVWMDYAALPLVLRQIEMKHRVFWIGYFAGGHDFAELYAHD